MYGELVTEGNISLNDAYQVGLKIEMVDIEDLSKRISNTQDPAIIIARFVGFWSEKRTPIFHFRGSR